MSGRVTEPSEEEARFKIENVEWPTSKANRIAIPPGWKTSYDAMNYLDGFCQAGDDQVVPAAAYRELFDAYIRSFPPSGETGEGGQTEDDGRHSPSGAADADLAEQVDDEWRGKVIDLADELDAEGKKDVAERVFALTLAFANTEPSPYAKAFRERVCPVPEFPGIQNQQEGQA